MKQHKYFELTSFIDSSYKIKFDLREIEEFDRTIKETFNENHIELINKFFNQYIIFLLDKSISNEAKEFINSAKLGLKQKFFFDIYTEICFSPLYSIEKEDPELIEIAITRTIHKLFFYSDLTLVGLIGDVEDFSMHTKRGTRFIHTISNVNKKLYEEVWLKINELNKNSPGKNIRRACISVSNKHPENLEDYENHNKLYKRFHKFMKENHINSIEDYLKYLSTIG